MTGSNVKFSQDGVTNNDQIHNKFTCHNLVNNLCQLSVTLSHHFSVTIKKEPNPAKSWTFKRVFLVSRTNLVARITCALPISWVLGEFWTFLRWKSSKRSILNILSKTQTGLCCVFQIRYHFCLSVDSASRFLNFAYHMINYAHLIFNNTTWMYLIYIVNGNFEWKWPFWTN